MEHILKSWLVDNSITTDNKEDKILLSETVGNVTLSDIYRLMRAEDTGLREETIRSATSQPWMYIAGSEDAATRAGNGSCTPGRNYVLNGRMLKIAGSDPSVGITLTSQSGSLIKLTAVNNPSQLIILLPADLTAGTYELGVTTQYAGGGKTLKTPRSMSKLITVGDDEPENPSELMYRSVQTACTGCAI